MLGPDHNLQELTNVVNVLAGNLTSQVRSIAAVTKAVAVGDLSKQIEVDARGEILDLKNTVNAMVIRLRVLAAEVTRVTLEVGSQGKLGGRADVSDVEGVWFELVKNVIRVSILVFPILTFFIVGEQDVSIVDGSSALHCFRHHRGRRRRLDSENRNRGRGRNAPTENDRQFHGGRPQLVC